MILIGVMSGGNSRGEEKLLKGLLSSCGKKTVAVQNNKLDCDKIKNLGDAGVDFLIMTLNKENIVPVYLDILILKSCTDITKGLIKCVAADTRLIYNIDTGGIPAFVHPNAIRDGMSYKAEATASSIDTACDGISFVYCLQRPVTALSGSVICPGEKKINLPGVRLGIDEIIAAVTCSELCGL